MTTDVRADSQQPLIALAVAVALLAPFFLYFPTVQSMVAIWNSSETFAHGYIILPISLWLIWRRRAGLMQMNPAPYWPALLLLAACGLAWLLGHVGDVQIVQQYAFVAMIPLTVLATLGPQIAGAIAFPLLFLLFAVPFGEIFIDPLIGVTANFAAEAVRLTGIPILREGNNFTLPTGNWAVVEACSGVRYLISSFTLGCLYAYLTYRSTWRRILFGLISIVVPIIANGMRAYMIVMIGHLSGMTLAVGIDHVIYGWLFFGLVMFLMFWIGGFWREDESRSTTDERDASAKHAGETPAASLGKMCINALGVAAILGAWPAYSLHIDRSGIGQPPVVLSGLLPQAAAAAPFADWKPAFAPASASSQQFYRVDDHDVGLSLLYYRNQHHGAELISSTNRVVGEKDPMWRRVEALPHKEAVANRMLAVQEVALVGASKHLLVWSWFWVDGRFVGNPYLGKLLQVKQKIFTGNDDGAAVMVFAPYDEKPEEARVVMRSFLDKNLAAIETTLAGNRH
ncbi:MAG: exosortase A [Burkholderiaceae bacterium]|nr:exosortase A [Burkholderiaceae bacterium]